MHDKADFNVTKDEKFINGFNFPTATSIYKIMSYLKNKKTGIPKIILKKYKGEFILTDFKTYYKTSGIKTVWL